MNEHMETRPSPPCDSRIEDSQGSESDDTNSWEQDDTSGGDSDNTTMSDLTVSRSSTATSEATIVTLADALCGANRDTDSNLGYDDDDDLVHHNEEEEDPLSNPLLSSLTSDSSNAGQRSSSGSSESTQPFVYVVAIVLILGFVITAFHLFSFSPARNPRGSSNIPTLPPNVATTTTTGSPTSIQSREDQV